MNPRVLLAGFLALTLLGCDRLPFFKKEQKEAKQPPVAETETAAPQEAAVNTMIGGMYSVSGVNPDGEGNYTGTVLITPKGSIYELEWSVGNNYSGIGVRMGDILSVSWGTSGQQGFGVVAYQIRPDGSLSGAWATTDSTDLGAEQLTPQ